MCLVTATRDRRSDPEPAAESVWDDRPIIGMSRGLPWWGAVLLAFGLTAIAAFVDMKRQDSLGLIYQGAFVLGCVGAVCWVRRRSLFGPMVQPPLVFAVTAIGAVLLLDDKAAGGGLKKLLFSAALPLTSNFPTMGITSAVTVAIGFYRLWKQRDPDPEVRPNRSVKERGLGLDLDDEPGQGTGGRGLRDRPSRDRGAPAPRARGRGEPEDPVEESRSGRRVPGRSSRPNREPGREGGREGGRDAVRDAGREGARDSGRQPRPGRRDAAPRAERGRTEPPPDTDRAARGRNRGRQAEPPPPRRRDPGEGRSRDDRGSGPRRDTNREPGREPGRGSAPRQPRRRPPDDYRDR